MSLQELGEMDGVQLLQFATEQLEQYDRVRDEWIFSQLLCNERLEGPDDRLPSTTICTKNDQGIKVWHPSENVTVKLKMKVPETWRAEQYAWAVQNGFKEQWPCLGADVAVWFEEYQQFFVGKAVTVTFQMVTAVFDKVQGTHHFAWDHYLRVGEGLAKD